MDDIITLFFKYFDKSSNQLAFRRLNTGSLKRSRAVLLNYSAITAILDVYLLTVKKSLLHRTPVKSSHSNRCFLFLFHLHLVLRSGPWKILQKPFVIVLISFVFQCITWTIFTKWGKSKENGYGIFLDMVVRH